MAILVIRQKATREESDEMLKDLGNYIKVAVDISKSVLAGGGFLHADCEALLIREGSRIENIWGADWYPENQKIRFEAMINLAPKRENRSMQIQDPKIRAKVEKVIRQLLEGV